MADGGAASGSGDAAGPAGPVDPDEAPEITSAAAAPPADEAAEAPLTPPLRPRGPFTDEEWERRQWLRRRAERDADHALQPLKRLLVDTMMNHHEQRATVEHLQARLQEQINDHGGTRYRMDRMERRLDQVAADMAELKRPRTSPPGSED